MKLKFDRGSHRGANSNSQLIMGFIILAIERIFSLDGRKMQLSLFGLILMVLISGCARQAQSPVRKVEVGIQLNENKKELEALVQSLHVKVNQYRGERNLPRLLMITNINAIARKHSAGMAQGVVAWGHQGSRDRFKQMSLHGAGLNKAENLARVWGRADPAQEALDSWIRSPSHKVALENPQYSVTGIGVAVGKSPKKEHQCYYFTQLYGSREVQGASKSFGARRISGISLDPKK